MKLVLTEKRDSTGGILNDAGKRNALSAALVTEFTNALKDVRTQNVRAMALRAMPVVKVWSAGHDVS